MVFKVLVPAIVYTVIGCMQCSASIVPTLIPDAAYIAATNLLAITDPIGSNVVRIADDRLTIEFSRSLFVSTVGSGWSTWGAPPQAEFVSPVVLHDPNYDETATMLVVTLSRGLRTLGFEVEPDVFDTRDVTVTYYSGGLSLGSITRAVEGYAGARLFAGTSADRLITSAIISSNTDFAVAQFRYGAVATPEPTSVALTVTGLVTVVLLTAWRKRRERPQDML
jgi:hypothetical protein